MWFEVNTLILELVGDSDEPEPAVVRPPLYMSTSLWKCLTAPTPKVSLRDLLLLGFSLCYTTHLLHYLAYPTYYLLFFLKFLTQHLHSVLSQPYIAKFLPR